jgi:hypothetical protein
MAYLNQVAKTEESRPLDAEQVANVAGLMIHSSIKATQASGRGFWQGLRGNVYIPDDQMPAPKARGARR